MAKLVQNDRADGPSKDGQLWHATIALEARSIQYDTLSSFGECEGHTLNLVH